MIGKQIILILVFLSAVVLWADSVEVELQLQKEEIYYGENVQLHVKVKNADSQAKIELEKLQENFQVEKLGDQSQNQSFVQIINGQVTRKEFIGHVFIYRLEPKKTGKLTIGPITVHYQGQSYQTQRAYLTVISSEASAQAFIKLSSLQSEYIIGESFTVNLDVYLKKLDGSLKEVDPLFGDSPPNLNIPWLKQQQDSQGLQSINLSQSLKRWRVRGEKVGFAINQLRRERGFSSFFDIDIPEKFIPEKTTVQTSYQNFPEHEYFRYRFGFSFRGNEVGSYQLGPVLLQGRIAVKTVDSYRAKGKKIVAAADPLVINISNPPLENRPDSYTGAIGSFQVSAQVEPKQGYVGDPLTLILEIQGQGPLAYISPPELTKQTQLNENFRIYNDTVNIETKDNKKIFRYTVRPKKTVTELPPIAFSYFDLDTRQYHTVTTKPLSLKISPVKTLTSSDLKIENSQSPEPAQELKTKQSSIAPNHTSSQALIKQYPEANFWKIVLLAFPPLAYLLLLGWQFYYKRWGSDISYQRKKKALTRAQKNIDKGQQTGSCETIENAVKGYFADHFNLSEHGLLLREVEHKVAKSKSLQAIAQKLREFSSLSEQIRFGGNPSSENLEKLSSQAYEIVTQAERKM